MSSKNKNNENEKETKKHQNRGARNLEEDAVARQRNEEENFSGAAAQYQGEYHEEGESPVRDNEQQGGQRAEHKNNTTMARDGKGGIGQNNLGQHNDRDDDFQSGSKGGNRSGKTGSKQGGSRGQGTK